MTALPRLRSETSSLRALRRAICFAKLLTVLRTFVPATFLATGEKEFFSVRFDLIGLRNSATYLEWHGGQSRSGEVKLYVYMFVALGPERKISNVR